MKEVVVRAEAELDIKTSYEWYEEKVQGLGANFMLCVEEAFSRISRNPKHFPTKLEPVRRAFVKRFPYGVYFIEREKTIVVLAVLHSRQRSERWKERT